MKILILRDCEVEMLFHKQCGNGCCSWTEREKGDAYKDEEYEVDDYRSGSITESGLASLEEGVDWVSQKSYEAGKKYARLAEMAMQAGKTVEEFFEVNQ